MIKCTVCNAMGANMKRCTSCGEVFCQKCATEGKAPYPKMRAINVCPYCGKYNTIEAAK